MTSQLGCCRICVRNTSSDVGRRAGKSATGKETGRRPHLKFVLVRDYVGQWSTIDNHFHIPNRCSECWGIAKTEPACPVEYRFTGLSVAARARARNRDLSSSSATISQHPSPPDNDETGGMSGENARRARSRSKRLVCCFLQLALVLVLMKLLSIPCVVKICSTDVQLV